MEKKIARTFIVAKMLENFGQQLIFPTYVPFLLAHGLSLFQSNQVNIAFKVTNALLDPLTGSLADKLGQKKVYLSGFVFLVVGCLVYGFGQSFWQFVLAEIIFAVGTVLFSEALEAWLSTRAPVGYGGIVAKASGFQRLCGIFAGIAGAKIAAKYGLNVPFFFCACIAFAAFFVVRHILARLPDTRHYEKGGSVKEALKLCIRVPQLRFLLMLNFGFTAGIQVFNMYWSVIFSNMTGSVDVAGYIWAAMSVFLGLGAFLAGRVKSITRTKIGLTVVSVGLFIGPAALTQNFWLMVAGFMAHELARGFLDPMLSTYPNEYIPEDLRATARSVASSAKTLGSIAGLLVFGWFTTFMNLPTDWFISGVFLVVVGFWAVVYRI